MAHSYRVPLKVLPASTSDSVHSDAHIDTNTPRMVTVCDSVRPICLPNRPASMEPTSGEKAASR